MSSHAVFGYLVGLFAAARMEQAGAPWWWSVLGGLWVAAVTEYAVAWAAARFRRSP